MLFSREFGIKPTNQDNWFDPLLTSDTLLFIDPFLIYQDDGKAWAGAHDELTKHFNDVFMLLAKSGLRQASPYYHRAISALTFPEPIEFCLGYTSEGIAGAGGGHKLARQIARAMVAAIRRGIKNLDHFEILGILNTGIGPDRVSDLTCTVLKERFIKYTAEVAQRHSLETADYELWVPTTQASGWRPIQAKLPSNPYSENDEPIILVPRRFLRQLPTLNAEDWWRWYGTKAGINTDILEAANKDKIVYEAIRNRASVRDWIAIKESDAPDPYDVIGDPDLVWKWEPLTLDFVSANPLKLVHARKAERFFAVVDRVIEQYSQFIENEGGWIHLYNDDKSEKNEVAAQSLFRGIAKHYCHANDISIDREVNLGRGPVDFKFSRGREFTAHLEVKWLHNGHFWHGLRSQLPDYMSSDDIRDGWLLAVRTRDKGVSQKRATQLPTEVAVTSKRLNLDLRYGLVDGRQQVSASKTKP